MSADNRDDDLDGDEQLASLRSVWVSMRESDEDPPDRGLAALMAAAREKASELAEPPRESWWQKVLATLRRPPVLALASVTVLLGGALFVTQRSDKLASEPTADDTRAGAPASVEQERALAPTTPPPPTSATAGSSSTAAPAVLAEPEPAPPAPVVKPAPSRGVKTPPRRPAAPPPEQPAPEALGASGLANDKGQDSDGELAKKAEPATRAPVRKQEATEPTRDTLDSVGVDVKASAQSTSEESRPARSKLVTQLVKQCESAAARGDCAAVRVIAGRIRSEDSSAYSQRVVKNSAIARCLDMTTVK